MSQNRNPFIEPSVGLRTVWMQKNLEEKQWSVIQEGNKQYLTINNKKYRIIDSHVTDFTSEPLISLGSSLVGREIIVLDPTSEKLELFYQTLRSKLSALPKETPTAVIIEVTMHFVLATLTNKQSFDQAKTVEAFCHKAENDSAVLKYEGCPVLPIEQFIKNHIGVCRHHALLLAYLLNHLQKDHVLKPGVIHHARDNVSSGIGHAWVMYKPSDSSSLFLIDSLWKTFVDLNQTANDARKLRGYGARALDNCRKKWGGQLPKPEITDANLLALLQQATKKAPFALQAEHKVPPGQLDPFKPLQHQQVVAQPIDPFKPLQLQRPLKSETRPSGLIEASMVKPPIILNVFKKQTSYLFPSSLGQQNTVASEAKTSPTKSTSLLKYSK